MEPTKWESQFHLLMSANWLISMGLQLAIIVAIATLVRRQRPDAWKPLLLWSIATTALWAWRPLARLLFRSAADSGVNDFYRVEVLTQAVYLPMHVALVALLIYGLVKLAQPPKPVVMPNEPPYR